MQKIKFIDVIIILAVILALVIGYLTYKNFRQTASQQIEATSKVVFQVYLRGVTITGRECPIISGDETFISIRNVPYTNLKINDVKIDTKKIAVPNPKGNPPFVLLEDYSQMFMYDILVTVEDMAKLTKDGIVIGGNKIKIGLPITLEGKAYKLNGTVSNVQLVPNAVVPPLQKSSEDSAQKEEQNKQEQPVTPQENNTQQSDVKSSQSTEQKPSNTPVKMKK